MHGLPVACLKPALLGQPLCGIKFCCSTALLTRPLRRRWLSAPGSSDGPDSSRTSACCRVLTTSKMYVPSDSFGGISPERKASKALQTLFTFIAVKVVLAQLEGSGRGALASMNPRSFETLQQMLLEIPMKDGDAWMKTLLQRDEMLALRILEVRRSYCLEDFEWDQLQRLTQEGVARSNTALMQQHAQTSFTKRMAAESALGSEQAADPRNEGGHSEND